MSRINISAETMEKAKSCKTPEELFSLAKKEGLELSMEQLDAVAGGSFPQNDWRPGCPTEDLSKPCDWYTCSQVYCDAFDCNSYSVMETESPVTTCPVAQE